MKKLSLFLILFMSSFFALGQDFSNDSIAKPSKTARWTTSDPFLAEEGFVGSYWRPTFMIAVDKFGYYCVVNLHKDNDYYNIITDPLPHLYLKTDDGRIVDLEMDESEPVYKTYQSATVGFGKVLLPGRYITSLIYVIPDIEDFLNNTYVKYRVWYGEGYKDVEIKKSYVKKFNKMLKEAYTEVNTKYEAKNKSLNNPLEGF